MFYDDMLIAIYRCVLLCLFGPDLHLPVVEKSDAR
jgi:hypothetical protein